MSPSKEYHSSFPPISFVSTDLLSYIFSNPNNVSPTKPIFIDAVTGETRTHSTTIHRTKCLVTGLQSLGVKPGDVVGLFSPNTIDYAIQCYAIIGCGAIVSPANYASTAPELHAQLETAGAKYLIAHSSLLPVAQDAVRGTEVHHLIQADGLLDAKSKPTATSMSATYPPGDLYTIPPTEADTRLAFLCFSSGTTGRAKGVMTSHKNMTSNLQQWIAHLAEDWSGRRTTVAFLPMSHMYGLNYFLCMSMFTGSTVVVMSKFDLPLYLRTISTYKTEVLVLVPPVVLLLVKSPLVQQYDLSHLKRLVCAAAPLSIELRKAVESRFKSLYGTETHCFQAWGLTETSPLATAVPITRTDKKHTVGCMAADMQFRLVDPETMQDVPEGSSGEIWCKGPNVTKGYYKNPEATANGFSDDGVWFRTGDIGTIDAEGYFQIVDRMKEMFKYKGLQVIPSELEGKLLDHPLIDDVGVIGVWHEEMATDVPTGFVVLNEAAKKREGGEKKAVEDIHKWLNEKVASHKRLRGGIRVIPAIPKSPSGKILRRELRDLIKAEAPKAKL